MQMSDFEVYESEHNMEMALHLVYDEWWERMLSAIETIDKQDIRKLSNPFVIKCLPAYRKANRKVLFVGQGTDGWGLFHETMAHFNYTDEDLQQEDIIHYLQWIYEGDGARQRD
jgi:hypothetical protein